MNQQTSELAILFADITKSSIIYEKLGDQAAQETVGRILQLMSDQTVKHDGRVIKTVGDAIISTFPSADNAITAAKLMQEDMAEYFPGTSDVPAIYIHIGLHFGPVVVENEDIFGDAVNTTARVVDYANPRQTIVTREIIDQLPADSLHHTRYITNITAKNIAGELELFEILCEEQTATTVIDARKLAKLISKNLYLTRGDETIVVDRQKPTISIGREEFNDIIIRYSWISRTHAYIENHNGVFLVKDKSTNGTFVYPEGGEPFIVSKGEHPLAGKGIIIFGREKDESAEGELTDTVGYDIR